MSKLKDKIEKKIDVVLKQYMDSPQEVYAPTLKEIKKDFFSNDIKLQENSIARFKSLLLTFRAWEPLDYYFIGEHKDKFVDDFNNVNEWYDFLESLVKDIEEYHDARRNNLDDKRN
jgi:hypothetical protein